MRGSGDDTDSVREEFLSEAQEIVETLSRNLLLLEQAQKERRDDPDLLNDIFRAVHTLKGLAGMFGMESLQSLAHTLENLLDDLRLGRVDISAETLDVLFEGVENFQLILTKAKDGETVVDVTEFTQSIDRIAEGRSPPRRSALDDFEIGEQVLSVLTEYEEHRLRSNIEQGMALFRLRVRFALASIDTSLEELKARARSLAELITYLPSMGGGDDDFIELEVLLASRGSIEDLREALCTENSTLEAVLRVGGAAQGEPEKPRHQTVVPGTISDPPPVPSRESAPPAQRAAAPHVPVAADPDVKGADALSLRSVANSVRVNIAKLDHLMNIVGELAIVRSAVAQMSERLRERPEFRTMSAEMHRISRSFERNLDELQDGILDVRMVPLGQVFDKLARVVRQTAREERKEIKLDVRGADTEVDKLIVEELSDPLMHLIRNAIDHGIERPDVRVDKGKPKLGSLSLHAAQKGNHVLIEVIDDGAGMNPEKLLAKAVEKGIVPAETARELSRDEIFSLIFLPGFSTSAAVTDLSGRGVGMDVVKTNIGKLGGVVDVRSEVDKGTTFTITLPITLAIISALVVQIARRTYAIPLANVQEALMLSPKDVRTVEGREVMTLRGGTLPLVRLQQMFHLRWPEDRPRGQYERQFVVVSQLGMRKLGMVVDSLVGQQDIVIKALGRSLSSVRGFAGATDLGDQRVALVLDTPQILEEVLAGGERSRLMEAVS